MMRRAYLPLLGLLECVATPSGADHDMVTNDLVYYLPTAPERAKRLLDTGEHILFIDLRTPSEFKQQHLPGAHSIPLNELDKRHPEIPKTGRVVLYCACPPGKVEEGYSYQLLRERGYRNVSVLEGGFAEWRARGYLLETGGGP